LPPALVATTKALVANRTNEPSDVTPSPILFRDGPGVRDLFLDFRDACKKQPTGRPFWSRGAEKAMKLALVRACSRDFGGQTICVEDLEWAIELVEWNTKLVLNLIAQNVSDGVHDQKKKKLLNVIRKNKRIKKSLLTRKTQWVKDLRERDGILDDLREGGYIGCETETKGEGRSQKTVTFFTYRKG